MSDDDLDPAASSPEQRPIAADLPWIGLFVVVLAFTVFALWGGINRVFPTARPPVAEPPAAAQPAAPAAPQPTD